MSFKLTPFLRQTQNQIQQFFLDQKTAFVSGLNVGSQRSQGLEFLFQKGDFSKNGFAGQLSFAYTDSYIKYGTLASGTVRHDRHHWHEPGHRAVQLVHEGVCTGWCVLRQDRLQPRSALRQEARVTAQPLHRATRRPASR